MNALIKLVLFFVAFFLIQKLIPFVFPRGIFFGASQSEWMQWTFGFRATAVGIIYATSFLIICGFPLTKLPVWMSIVHGALLGAMIGIAFFPYDLFDMGVLNRQLQPVVYAFICLTILLPWTCLLKVRMSPKST